MSILLNTVLFGSNDVGLANHELLQVQGPKGIDLLAKQLESHSLQTRVRDCTALSPVEAANLEQNLANALKSSEKFLASRTGIWNWICNFIESFRYRKSVAKVKTMVSVLKATWVNRMNHRILTGRVTVEEIRLAKGDTLYFLGKNLARFKPELFDKFSEEFTSLSENQQRELAFAVQMNTTPFLFNGKLEAFHPRILDRGICRGISCVLLADSSHLAQGRVTREQEARARILQPLISLDTPNRWYRQAIKLDVCEGVDLVPSLDDLSKKLLSEDPEYSKFMLSMSGNEKREDGTPAGHAIAISLDPPWYFDQNNYEFETEIFPVNIFQSKEEMLEHLVTYLKWNPFYAKYHQYLLTTCLNPKH